MGQSNFLRSVWPQEEGPGAKTALQAISWHLKYMETSSEFFCLETSYLHFEPHPYKFDFENIALAPWLTFTKGGDRDC